MDIPPAYLITSTTRQSDRPRVVNPHKLPARFADIVGGIARTSRILVLSGDGALAGTGLLSMDAVKVQQTSDSRRVSLRNLMQEMTRGLPDALPTERLAMYNQAMAERRVAARNAGRNVFLDYLDRICHEGRLTKCLTTSIDGLKAQSLQSFSSKVVSLYGDNRVGLPELQTASLDDSMISQVVTPCEECTASYKKANQTQRRRKGGDGTRLLRPAVQSHISLSFTSVDAIIYEDNQDEDEDYVDKPSKSQAEVTAGSKGKKPRRPKRKPVELPSLDTTKIREYLEGSKLLLIVGSQPRDPDLLNLARELAMVVHDSNGAVVYLDEAPLQGLQYDHIDIQLQADIQDTLGDVIQQMQRAHGSGEHEEGADFTDADFWFNLLENDIPVRMTEQEAPYTGVICWHCGCGITDYLVACIQCSHRYCYRRVDNPGSDDSDSDEELELQGGGRTALIGELPSSSEGSRDPEPVNSAEDASVDRFKFHDACIALNILSNQASLPSLADATRSFICPGCWNHKEMGLYPHFVRPIARDSVEMKQEIWPRLAMCILEPVKLQHLEEKQDVFRDLRWEPGSYQVVAVYITHGLAGEQGYQLNSRQALRPAELLTQTLRIAHNAITAASSSSVFFFSCGHPLHHPGIVKELSDWFDKYGSGFTVEGSVIANTSTFRRTTFPDVVVGCLNKKLSPVYMFNMFSKLTQAMAGGTAAKSSLIRNTWLRDTVAYSHSDLLCLARGHPAELWLYAPFQSRPLGRPLPSLLNVCSCSWEPKTDPAEGEEGAVIPLNKRRRKVWKVDHNGRPGMALRDVKVKAICRACRQAWPLPQEALAGTLIRVHGVYGAIVPYFA